MMDEFNFRGPTDENLQRKMSMDEWLRRQMKIWREGFWSYKWPTNPMGRILMDEILGDPAIITWMKTRFSCQFKGPRDDKGWNLTDERVPAVSYALRWVDLYEFKGWKVIVLSWKLSTPHISGIGSLKFEDLELCTDFCFKLTSDMHRLKPLEWRIHIWMIMQFSPIFVHIQSKVGNFIQIYDV